MATRSIIKTKKIQVKVNVLGAGLLIFACSKILVLFIVGIWKVKMRKSATERTLDNKSTCTCKQRRTLLPIAYSGTILIRPLYKNYNEYSRCFYAVMCKLIIPCQRAYIVKYRIIMILCDCVNKKVSDDLSMTGHLRFRGVGSPTGQPIWRVVFYSMAAILWYGRFVN